jgi:serine/threonine protein phosphatase 1
VELISPKPSDTIVTLGDYVDRGPDSRGVLDYLIDLRKRCNLVPLFGNHEEMFYEVVIDDKAPYDWLRHGGVDTLDSYGFVGDLRVIPDTHRDFLRSLVDYYQTDKHFFVHANYDPDLELSEQPPEMLRWIKLTDVMPAPHRSNLRAIVGHTHHRTGEILELPHLICLDTYCYGGFWLTAMDVESGQIWQVDNDGLVREQASDTRS